MDRADAERGDDAKPLRVRVLNDAASKQERFTLQWDGTNESLDAYVPPGESRVVKVPRPASQRTAAILRLHGDAHEFDNALHFATPKQEELTVHYFGSDDARDEAGLRYFLERAWSESPERIVKLAAHKPDDAVKWDELKLSPLVVIAGETVHGERGNVGAIPPRGAARFSA